MFGFGLIVAAILVAGHTAGAQALRMGGTGAVSAMLPQLFTAFGRGEEVKLEVIPGPRPQRRVKAAVEGALDIVVAGRALNAAGACARLTPVLTIRTPYGLVTSHRSPHGFKNGEIAATFRSQNPTWADGSPIRIILRPRIETDTFVLGIFVSWNGRCAR